MKINYITIEEKNKNEELVYLINVYWSTNYVPVVTSFEYNKVRLKQTNELGPYSNKGQIKKIILKEFNDYEKMYKDFTDFKQNLLKIDIEKLNVEINKIMDLSGKNAKFLEIKMKEGEKERYSYKTIFNSNEEVNLIEKIKETKEINNIKIIYMLKKEKLNLSLFTEYDNKIKNDKKIKMKILLI